MLLRFKQLGKMCEIGIIVLGLITVNNSSLGGIRDGSRRFAPPVPVDKRLLTFCLVCKDEPVHLPPGDIEGHSSPVLVTFFVNQLLDHIVFLLFIHCQFCLSDNISSLPRRLFYHIKHPFGTFSFVVY